MHCAVIGTVHGKYMDQGSDMQGTPPRDLRVFRNIIASIYAGIYVGTVWVCLCVPVWVKEIALAQITKEDVTKNRRSKRK